MEETGSTVFLFIAYGFLALLSSHHLTFPPFRYPSSHNLDFYSFISFIPISFFLDSLPFFPMPILSLHPLPQFPFSLSRFIPTPSISGRVQLLSRPIMIESTIR